jgi:hypothetical protein
LSVEAKAEQVFDSLQQLLKTGNNF